MTDLVVQRLLTSPEPRLARLYCRYRKNQAETFPTPGPQGRRSIHLPRGTSLRTDTYFNAFFESYWRQYTRLARLELRVRISGHGTLRLYRRSVAGLRLLETVEFSGDECELRLVVPQINNIPRATGLLFAEILAGSEPVILREAEWVARDVEARPARLVVGYCTFNRASQLILNIAALLEDPDVANVLDGVVVVDQGDRKVLDHPDYPGLAKSVGDRLRIVQQENFGGAGGFTRCIFEALANARATHVLLMDDDATVEPESVLRATAFLALARADLAVGGHMLDQSRPHELVEAGNRCQPHLIAVDPPSRSRVDQRQGLTPFLDVQTRDYNGWWFFAFPLTLVDRVGLPLPLFLRGDDVEFGYRLLRAGVPTVPLPGVAVWHEPFEFKGRGWQPFYEMRNLLAVTALHFAPYRAGRIGRRFLKRLLEELLAYDYYEAWLLCEAVAAYLRGPDLLRFMPLAGHHRLMTAQKALVPAALSRNKGSLEVVSPALCLNRWVRLAGLLMHLVRNLIWPCSGSDSPPSRVIPVADERWYGVAWHDVVGVDDPYREGLVVLRRSHSRFVGLLFRGLWLALRLMGSHHEMRRRWQEGYTALTTRVFWAKYLGLSSRADSGCAERSKPVEWDASRPVAEQGRSRNLVFQEMAVAGSVRDPTA